MKEITDEVHEALMKAHENSSKLVSKGKSSTNVLLCAGWQPIETAPKDGTVILVRGQYEARGRSNMLAAAAKYDLGNWWRHNNGYGFTVTCYPEEWIEGIL